VQIPLEVADLDEAHACLGEATCEEALPAKGLRGRFVRAVELERFFALAAEIHHARQLALHAKGQLIAVDDAFHARIGGLGEQISIHRLEQVELLTLRGVLQAWIRDVAERELRAGPVRIAKQCGGACGGQKRAGVVAQAAERGERIDGDEARQIGILRAEPVHGPRAHGGPHKLKTARVELLQRLRMVFVIRRHATQQAELVRVLRDLRHQLHDVDAALPVLGEFPLRAEQLHVASLRPGWPVRFVSSGLGSNVSICDGPPRMQRKMTRFAFAGKCEANRLSAEAMPANAR
jgi:hypothetical protein